MEIPLLHHNRTQNSIRAIPPARYLLDNINNTILPHPPEINESVFEVHRTSGVAPSQQSYRETQRGYSSAKNLRSFSDDSLVVVTALLPENPKIISVTALGGSHSTPRTVELDTSRLDSFSPSSVIKTETFLEETAAEEEFSIRPQSEDDTLLLQLLDKIGRVVVIRLNLSQKHLTPIDLATHDLPSLISERFTPCHGAEIPVGGAVWLTPMRVVLTLSPVLLCADLEEGSVVEWKRGTCKEWTYARRTSVRLYSMLGAGDEDDEGEAEVPSAVCLCAGDNDEGIDGLSVFSLHSDGSVRMWSVPTAGRSTYPTSMRRVRVASPLRMEEMSPPSSPPPAPNLCDPPLPESNLWSSNYDSLSMACEMEPEGSGYTLAVAVKTSSIPTFSTATPSQPPRLVTLLLLRGTVRVGIQQSEAECVSMGVPVDVHTCCDMSFAPGDGCRLTCLFSSTPNDTSIVARYDVSEGPSPAPEVVELSLDFVAREEYAAVSPTNTPSSKSVTREELSSIDGLYMRRIFRPAGIGIAPSVTSVRNALGRFVDDDSEIAGTTMEQKTLMTVRECARKDEADALARARHGGGSPGDSFRERAAVPSVYDAFVSQGEREDSGTIVSHSLTPSGKRRMSRSSDETGDSSSPILDKAGLHHARWRKLMVAILEEETALRAPLSILALPSFQQQIGAVSCLVLRVGTVSSVSYLKPLPDKQDKSPGESLDKIAIALLNQVRNGPETGPSLHELEQTLSKIVEGSSFDSGWEISKALKVAVSDFIFLEEEKASVAVREMEEGAFRNVLASQFLRRHLPFGSLLDDGEFTPSPLLAGEAVTASSGITHVTGYLTRGLLDSARKLALARCLLLARLQPEASQFPSGAFRDATRSYLGVLSVCHAASRPVLECVDVDVSSGAPPRRSSRRKAVRFSRPKRMMTVLDAHALSFSPDVNDVSNIVRTGISSSLSFVRSALTSTSDLARAVYKTYNRPGLALKLLVPLLTFEDSDHDVSILRTMAGECLLLETSSCVERGVIDLKAASALRFRASNLLRPDIPVVTPYLLSDLANVFQVIISGRKDDWYETGTSGNEGRLIQMLGAIVHPSTDEQIARMARLPTCRALLLPLAPTFLTSVPSHLLPDFRTLLDHLRTFSSLLYRLSLFEKHGRDHEIMQTCASDALKFLSTSLPPDLVRKMSETPALWSAAFLHASRNKNWDVALEACLGNPLSERQHSGFRRLVANMVECGRIGELMRILESDGGRSASWDLYETACEVLEERAAVSVRAGKGGCDYRGCLYALHAGKKNWRRAAEVMDRTADYGGDEGCLAAVASLNAIRLVKDRSERFLVNGEYGGQSRTPDNSFPYMALDGGEILARKKRGRGVASELDNSDRAVETVSSSPVADRFSRLMTEHHLEKRAMLIIARRVLKDTTNSNEDLVTSLASAGHYTLAITIARKVSENSPRGNDRYAAFLSEILCGYLAPVAVSLSRPTPRNATSNIWEMELDGHIPSRTRILQDILWDGRNEEHHLPCFSGVEWRRLGNGEPTITKGKAANELLRKLTTTYSKTVDSISVDVARKLLDLDGGRANLPAWLTRLLTGPTGRPGLFANRHDEGGTVADPAALLRLFMEKNSHVSACDLVTRSLIGEDSGAARRAAAPSRLPTKGNVDFVPYDTIDALYDSIGRAIDECDDDRERTRRTTARDKMVKALEFHFEMMKISEMGIKSARALQMAYA